MFFALFTFCLARHVIFRVSTGTHNTFGVRPQVVNPGGVMLTTKVRADQDVPVFIHKSAQRMSPPLSGVRPDGFHFDGWQEQFGKGVLAAREEQHKVIRRLQDVR